MARKKKPSGREVKHRVWIPDDGYGGLTLTDGHGMMRIDGWPDGTFEYRYVFGWDQWLEIDGMFIMLFDSVHGNNRFPSLDVLKLYLDEVGPHPYERLDSAERRDTFGQAKMDAPENVQAWVEVTPDHRWAVSTEIT